MAPVDGDDGVDPEKTVLEWLPVADPPGSKIVGYEVIVATEDPKLREFKVDVTAETTSVRVPAAFVAGGPEFKWEVLAIESSGYQTLSEGGFRTD